MTMRRWARLGGLMLMLAACPAAAGNDAAAPAAAKGGAVIPDALQRNLEAAPLVLEAEVVAVRKSPGAWSGTLAIYQDVEYRARRPIKGELAAGAAVTVGHLLVMGSPTAEPRRPELRGSLFRPGARLVIFARREARGWVALNEVDAVAPATDELVTALAERARKK